MQEVVKEGGKEGVSVCATASHSSKSNLRHLSKKTEAEADAEALQQQEQEEEGEERAKETKVDYRNDTQVSTKEKEKEKEKEKKSAEGHLKGSFGVLPSHPPANVEVCTAKNCNQVYCGAPWYRLLQSSISLLPLLSFLFSLLFLHSPILPLFIFLLFSL